MSALRALATPALISGLAVALAATSLTGVLTGSRWWGLVVVAIVVVVAAGILLRLVRLPPIIVAAGQLVALTGLITAVFTGNGVLMVLPGPDALRELAGVFYRATQQIDGGVPPVPESPELLCLMVLALGLVAVTVDTISVAAVAPAASGLVLLCVVALPASLADGLLPWWSFSLGASGFALLLTMDGRRRHVARDQPVGPGGNIGSVPAAVVVGVGATVVALLAGVSLTAVGTEGRLAADGQPVHTGIGVNPFTSLHGQLTARENVELFRVHGLAQRSYLRALTLSRFTAGQGWRQDVLDDTLPARDRSASNGLPLPVGVAEPVVGPAMQVQIEPISYVDRWLPTFGYPLHLGDIGTDWRYDAEALTVFSQLPRHAEPYTEIGVLPQPDPSRLRAAGPGRGTPFTAVDPQYLDTTGVDPRIVELAAEVTTGAPTAFDATIALNEWFTGTASGFRYELQTTPGSSGDALVDFLVTGRAGYCEQFASAMAVMLRTLGIPARVAVGFTPGTPTGSTPAGEVRVITTDDAHAWVEVWFPGSGWLPFDPTPLVDGRTVVPDYAAPVTPNPPSSPPPAARQALPPAPVAPNPVETESPELAARDGDGGTGAGSMIGLTIGGMLVLAAVTGCIPLAVRELRRRQRLKQVHTGGPGAASAAWEELLAESADRGVRHPAGETVRRTAARLINDHRLDAPGRAGMGALVAVVERSWYGGTDEAHEVAGALAAVRDSMDRCAPHSARARLLPRSVLPHPGGSVAHRPVPRRRRQRAADDIS